MILAWTGFWHSDPMAVLISWIMLLECILALHLQQMDLPLMSTSVRLPEQGGNELFLLLEQRRFDLLSNLGGLPQEVVQIPENPINSFCHYCEDVSKVLVSGFLVRQEVLGSLSLRSFLSYALDGFLELFPCLHALLLLQVREKQEWSDLVKVFKLKSTVKIRESFQSHMRRPCFPNLQV